MKKFDLQKAIEGKPLVYRNGERVKRFIYVPESNDMGAKIITVGIYGGLGFHFENGKRWHLSEGESDLFMASEKKTVWVNLYERYGKIETGVDTYEHEHIARNSWIETVGEKYIGTYSFEIEV